MTELDPALVKSWLRIGSPAAMASAVTRSHLPDGRCVGWYGPVPDRATIVIDAESTDRAVPPALARRFGEDGFWQRWTRAECAAKVSGVPMAVWVTTLGLAAPTDYAYCTLRPAFFAEGMCVSVAISVEATGSPQTSAATPSP